MRRDKLIVMSGLVLISLLAWGWMLLGAGMGMSGIEMTRHSMMDMDVLATTPWTPGYASLMFFMWWIMMIAMMIPGAAPFLLMAAAINRQCEPDRKPFGSTAAFCLGYLLTWAVFSLVAVMLQWLLAENQLINSMLQSRSQALSASILLLAGLWQFMPWKNACLKHCRGPVEFLTLNRRSGNAGALVMGAHHGAYCLGCCWFLMALLFVGGVMNLIWIAGLAIYVWVEKVMPGGMVISRIMGAVLIIWGVSILIR